MRYTVVGDTLFDHATAVTDVNTLAGLLNAADPLALESCREDVTALQDTISALELELDQARQQVRALELGLELDQARQQVRALELGLELDQARQQVRALELGLELDQARQQVKALEDALKETPRDCSLSQILDGLIVTGAITDIDEVRLFHALASDTQKVFPPAAYIDRWRYTVAVHREARQRAWDADPTKIGVAYLQGLVNMAVVEAYAYKGLSECLNHRFPRWSATQHSDVLTAYREALRAEEAQCTHESPELLAALRIGAYDERANAVASYLHGQRTGAIPEILMRFGITLFWFEKDGIHVQLRGAGLHGLERVKTPFKFVPYGVVEGYHVEPPGAVNVPHAQCVFMGRRCFVVARGLLPAHVTRLHYCKAHHGEDDD